VREKAHLPEFGEGDAGNVTLPWAFGPFSDLEKGPENALQALPGL